MRNVVTTFVGIVACTALAAEARAASCTERHKDNATWLSIAHPGLGEWYLDDWKPFFSHAPQKKFWLGFIPLFGWPGYLQIKSAVDANQCQKNDELFEWD
jgi:hypothetical protein